jgi:zinc/manganese transport system substrate-binding protein
MTRISEFRRGRVLGLALVPLLALGVLGCNSTTHSAGGKIAAVAGENFYGDLVARIGGDRVSVTSIISDPNVDPHSYETNTQNAEAVADATLVVENGLGYDAFLDRLLGASPRSDRKLINVQQLLGSPDGSNAHLWYDPATMPKVARAVTDALNEIEPASKATFEANLQTFLDSLGQLTSRISEVKARFPGTAVAYTEPVPEYLLRVLGFRSLTPEGFAKSIEDGTDPAPGDVAAERDLLTGKKVKLLLYNKQTTSPVTEAIKSLATQSGIPVVGVSETIPTQGEGYVEWQLAQLAEIETALGAVR